MTGAQFDTSEVRAFAARLSEAGKATQKQVRGVVEKGAINIKNQMRSEASGSSHFGQVAPTINYDIRVVGAFGGGIVEAEIGPNKARRAARIANIGYFGGANGGGNTLPDPQGALDAEAPNLEKWLGDAAEGAL